MSLLSSQRLLGMTYQERAANNCISIERADLVLAGCAILDAIRNAFPLPRLRVADRGLREGMLVEMMREDGALRSRGEQRTRTLPYLAPLLRRGRITSKM